MAEELTEKEFYLPHITYRIDSAERKYKKVVTELTERYRIDSGKRKYKKVDGKIEMIALMLCRVPFLIQKDRKPE